MPQAAGYVAAKHGVIGLARSLALDFGPKGVRVNTICPGWVRTPMADREMETVMEVKGLTLDGAYDLVTCDTPLRRAGMPSEIAALCKFLIDDESSIITGAVIPADAGSTVVCAPTIRL
jgi:NAD(P)-dependent dehydrogenase (short-subunit alcohol dehydrogenase family)